MKKHTKKPIQSSQLNKNKENINLNIDKRDVCLSEKTPFGITEAYKTIRTNILYSIVANKNKTIIVSSSGPSEGKSTTCANIAIALSQTSAKVLIIDADMRKPTQHKIFHIIYDVTAYLLYNGSATYIL